jgi:hypothetical protein
VRDSLESQEAVAVLDGSEYSAVVLADEPIFYYRLDETDAQLSTGAQYAYNSGTAGATQQYRGIYNPPVVHGIHGAVNTTNLATSFGGGWITCFSGAKVPTGEGTLEAWVRAGTVQTGSHLPDGTLAYREGGIVGQWDWVDKHGVALIISSGGNYGMACRLNGLYAHTASGLPTGTSWDHVVGTWQPDGGTYTRKLWVNNALVASDQTVYNVVPVPNFGIEIGNYNGVYYGVPRNPLVGSLDEVAVYDYALSGTQVAAHYAAGRFGGVRDYLVNDSTVTSFEYARKRGDLELARYADVITNVSFDSWVPGWQLGDSVPIDVSSTTGGHNFVGSALIQELDIVFVGAQKARFSARCQSTRFNFLDYQKKLLGIQNQAIQAGLGGALEIIERGDLNPGLVVPGTFTATVNTPPFHVEPDWGSGTTPFIKVGFWCIDPTLY